MECILNWLFSSFTYLPILPSFSSPRLVQLAGKCHLVIFAFVQFLDLFHSVKKVCKPSNHLCIKEDLGYFDKDNVLRSFIEGKKFCSFVFSFICMICKWRGDFIGDNFPNGGGGGGGNFNRREAFRGGNFLGG